MKNNISRTSGFQLLDQHLDYEQQKMFLKEIRNITLLAPLYTPVMPRTGKSMSVRMTACGRFGWYSDKQQGYRYIRKHPVTGKKWPALPLCFTTLWHELTGLETQADCAVINYYQASAKMGLHQDRDEKDFFFPVVSVSLGDRALFRIGGTNRKDPTRSVQLNSGDVCILGNTDRLAWHGIDKIYPDTSVLLKNGGRLNITLRRVESGERS